MTLLFKILRAAHARGTHHKLALDALEHLSGPSADAWRRLFLKHADLYMQGAKAPDDEFKDFKNHVLHVRDGYWGGAADKSAGWYDKLVDALRGARWSEAVWAAGVLSHYYTDPIHPFHTGQTQAENDIHRAVEWSINRSYDALKREGDSAFAGLRAAPGDGPEWLRSFVIDGAEKANAHYEALIAHYDISRGVVDPPSGLDVVGRRIVAELLRFASTGLAAVLDRALAEAVVAPPDVSLSLETVLAALRIPVRQLMKRMENAAEAELVQRMYDELRATGKVEHYLPDDDRSVRDLYATEVLAAEHMLRAEQRAAALARPVGAANRLGDPRQRVAQGASVTQSLPPIRPPAPASSGAMPSAVRSTAPGGGELAGLSGGRRARQMSPALSSPALSSPAFSSPAFSSPVSGSGEASLGGSTRHAGQPEVLRTLAERKVHLAVSDDVERAPSIGPKTAERLYAIGVRTVGDLLGADPAGVALQLDAGHINAAGVAAWQDQCRLVMSVPGLRGGQAQLLVGAGYRSAADLARADIDDLMAAMLAFVATNEGQRVLRDGQPPDIERIAGWIAAARSQAA